MLNLICKASCLHSCGGFWLRQIVVPGASGVAAEREREQKSKSWPRHLTGCFSLALACFSLASASLHLTGCFSFGPRVRQAPVSCGFHVVHSCLFAVLRSWAAVTSDRVTSEGVPCPDQPWILS